METMPFNDEMDKSDLDALASLGLFAFGESRLIDQTIREAPKSDGMPVDGGARHIKMALENAERQVKAKAWQQHQQMYPTIPSHSYPEMPSMVPNTPIQQPLSIIHQQPTQIIDNSQLEFNFDPKKQDITNDLLKDILGKLTKLILLLEKQNSKEEVVKLK